MPSGKTRTVSLGACASRGRMQQLSHEPWLPPGVAADSEDAVALCVVSRTAASSSCSWSGWSQQHQFHALEQVVYQLSFGDTWLKSPIGRGLYQPAVSKEGK